MKPKRILIAAAVGFVAATAIWRFTSGQTPQDLFAMSVSILRSKIERKTVADRVAGILAKRPPLAETADSIGNRLAIFVFKRERAVEVRAPGWTAPRTYAMTGTSGGPGPKLREGDRQIPEGVYVIESLNPNSAFHLSLRVSYPNAFDRERAREDGRTNLGGDIMIHGGRASVGCIPVGDDNIEELFLFAARVGVRNVRVVIAPYDMRPGRRPEWETAGPPWYSGLCDAIAAALRE